MAPIQVLDSTKVLSGYVYQIDHTAINSHAPKRAVLPASVRPDATPKIVAASNQKLILSSSDQILRLDFLAPNRRRPSVHSLSPNAAINTALPGMFSATEAFLNFENVKGKGRPPVFEVYLQSKDDQGKVIELHVGPLALFGLSAASQPSTHHNGSGQHLVLEMSEQLLNFRNSANWDSAGLSIRLHPRKPLAANVSVSIGRISLYLK